MKQAILIVCVAVVLGLVSAVMAVEIETVHVGNPGNADDTHDDGYGGVDYTYNIGKYEVTAGQYRDFLNAVDPNGANPYGVYNSSMNSDLYGCQITWNATASTYDFSGGTVEASGSTAADWQDRPVNYVSWGDAARFANWLHNGQPTGTLTGDPAQDAGLTEDGAYFLNGATSNEDLLAVSREADWKWAIPTEDEWYKAAYYEPDKDPNTVGDQPGYYDYPTSTDSVPSNDLVAPTDPGNNATFYISDGDYTIGSPYYRTEFGAHENSESPYDTFDQGGNVWEWHEAILYGSYRGVRGGSFYPNVIDMHASHWNGSFPALEDLNLGFRVAEVPEPATLSLLALGSLALVRRRKRGMCK